MSVPRAGPTQAKWYDAVESRVGRRRESPARRRRSGSLGVRDGERPVCSEPPHPSSPRPSCSIMSSLAKILNTDVSDVRELLRRLQHSLPLVTEAPTWAPSNIATALHVIVSYFENPTWPSTRPSSISSVLPAPRHDVVSPQLAHGPTTKFNVRINRVTVADVVYYNQEGHVLEYPETSKQGSIGHLLAVDPGKWEDPCQNIVYARGTPSGSSRVGEKVRCELLRDQSGTPVPCRRFQTTCMLFLSLDMDISLIIPKAKAARSVLWLTVLFLKLYIHPQPARLSKHDFNNTEMTASCLPLRRELSSSVQLAFWQPTGNMAVARS